MAIDTPGFRRSKSINTDVDFYGSHRAQRSIRRADVVLLFFDATQRIGQVDKQLCEYIAQQYKPCMFVVNKWDMVAATMPTEKWVVYVRDSFARSGTSRSRSLPARRARTSRRCSTTPNALPPVAAPGDDFPVEQAASGGVRAEPSADLSEPPSEGLLRDASGGPAADSRFVLQRSEGDCRAIPAYLLQLFRESLNFGEVPIKLYLRRREHDDNGTKATREGGLRRVGRMAWLAGRAGLDPRVLSQVQGDTWQVIQDRPSMTQRPDWQSITTTMFVFNPEPTATAFAGPTLKCRLPSRKQPRRRRWLRVKRSATP